MPTTGAMMRLCHRARDQRGFTLVETLSAMFILLVGVLGTAQLIDAAAGANSANRQRDTATNVARELIEAARGIPYERVSTPGVISVLQQIPGLEDAPGSSYVIRRNNVDYTVAFVVCIMDDPKDGAGPRPATATFCASSATPGTEDKNPEDYKRVTATISWQRNGRETQIVQTGVINNPGSASGPAIRTLIPQGLVAPYVVTSTATSVLVEATTSSRPAAINWLLDGTVKQPPPTQYGDSGLVWRFSWNIGPVDGGTLDGEYILGAEATNQYGVSGPGRSETVILNRRVPFAPQDPTGGRTNFGTVEIEWTANRERDIIGYQVARIEADKTETVVCPLVTQQLQTSCVDTAPPDAEELRYVVRAYDRASDTGEARAGNDSKIVQVFKGENTAPFPPTDLQGQRDGDVVTLTWNRPSPQDPDAGDGVEFYRIYRDGQALGHRYERWFDSRPQAIWQDTETGGLTHKYWVTAVDKHFAESPFLGPVTK